MENIHTTSYQPPVAALLTQGECQSRAPSNWLNYLELGFGPEHIPDLIRMATDEKLHLAPSDTLEVWAPIHAWHALIQLRATEEMAEPLLLLFDMLEDDEWAMEELPEIYGMIGPAALPALATYIADDISHSETARIFATASVERIGQEWSDARNQCVELLTRQLERFAEIEPDVNASTILALVELQAREAAPVIEHAFAAKRVDLLLIGGWDDVQVELGLKSPQEIQQKQLSLSAQIISPLTNTDQHGISSHRVSPKLLHGQKADCKKAKSKMTKQSRKKNRK